MKSRTYGVFHKSFLIAVFLLKGLSAYAQQSQDQILVKSSLVSGKVHLLYCVDGFGGGNVAASIGEDGILLVDNMYAHMNSKLTAHLQTLSTKAVRIVLNTHFHRDHIEGNKIFKTSAVIIAHENVKKNLLQNNKPAASTLEMLPVVTFRDRVTITFNGEEVQLIHFPNSHTDGDAIVYFTQSNVLHLGDMFFFNMFPAVYTKGGGNIKQLIVSLDKILAEFPPDAKVIPGHGTLASMSDLKTYVAMLKETTRLVENSIQNGMSLEEMKAKKILAAYDHLGEGGAQTTDEYLTMLYGLLSPIKK